MVWNITSFVIGIIPKYLTSHGVKARVFVYQWGQDRGHRCVVFESGPKLAVYDEGGTRTLHHTTWATPPRQIAAALLKAARDKSKITKARWE